MRAQAGGEPNTLGRCNATRAQLDLFRIDLASIVSKYIGETEKNLARIFACAERVGAVLFFDEADALFGKRSEVRDSHDRYANLEIAYLLQRMETYGGLAVLATNLVESIDDAFARRLAFTIYFPSPEYEERLRIWTCTWPPCGRMRARSSERGERPSSQRETTTSRGPRAETALLALQRKLGNDAVVGLIESASPGTETATASSCSPVLALACLAGH